MERPDDRAEKAQADGAGEFENSISPVPAAREGEKTVILFPNSPAPAARAFSLLASGRST